MSTRDTGPGPGLAAGVEDAPEGAPPGGPTPMSTCSPSVSGRARFTVDRSTPGRTPPAARTASTTREPAGSTAMPGCRTLPATSTTIWPEATGEADVPVPDPLVTGVPDGCPEVPAALGAGTVEADATAGTLGRGGAATPSSEPPALSSHHADSTSPAATITSTSPAWADPRCGRDASAGGTRSPTQPASRARHPGSRRACLPGRAAPSVSVRARAA